MKALAFCLALAALSGCKPVVLEVTECKFASCRVLLKDGGSIIVPDHFGKLLREGDKLCRVTSCAAWCMDREWEVCR